MAYCQNKSQNHFQNSQFDSQACFLHVGKKAARVNKGIIVSSGKVSKNRQQFLSIRENSFSAAVDTLDLLFHITANFPFPCLQPERCAFKRACRL